MKKFIFLSFCFGMALSLLFLVSCGHSEEKKKTRELAALWNDVVVERSERVVSMSARWPRSARLGLCDDPQTITSFLETMASVELGELMTEKPAGDAVKRSSGWYGVFNLADEEKTSLHFSTNYSAGYMRIGMYRDDEEQNCVYVSLSPEDVETLSELARDYWETVPVYSALAESQVRREWERYVETERISIASMSVRALSDSSLHLCETPETIGAFLEICRLLDVETLSGAAQEELFGGASVLQVTLYPKESNAVPLTLFVNREARAIRIQTELEGYACYGELANIPEMTMKVLGAFLAEYAD